MEKQVKFVDLDRMHGPIRQELDEAIARVIDAEDFILGEEMRLFEKEFADYCNAKKCMAVNSGSDALRLAVEAMGIGKGDEVIVPANTFISTAYAVSQNGGVPVFADVEEKSFNIDAKSVEEKINEKTKAIIPVHLYGQSADMKPIMELAEKHSLMVLEDACQAHGTEFEGKKAPVSGSACFSFYPGKNLGCFGDGGAFVTDDESLAGKVEDLRNYGSPEKYRHPIKGWNSRLDCIQAAVLRVKLKRLEKWTDSRRETAEKYAELLEGSAITLPKEMDYARHVYHVYCARHAKRDALRKSLGEKGIQTNIHYPKVIYEHGAYAELGIAKGECPVAEKLSREIISLPMFPGMTDEEIERVCGAIREF